MAQSGAEAMAEEETGAGIVWIASTAFYGKPPRSIYSWNQNDTAMHMQKHMLLASKDHILLKVAIRWLCNDSVELIFGVFYLSSI